MISLSIVRLQRLTATLLLALTIFPANAQDRVAIITEIAGSVELARSGSASFGAAEWGSPLFNGDRVRTAGGAQAVLLFSNNNLMTVSGGNTYTVGGQQGGSSRAVSSSVISSDTDLTLHRAGQGEVEVLGGLRNSGLLPPVDLAYPVRTVVTSNGPEFFWVADDEYEAFTVSVRGPVGEIWSGETTDISIMYPADAPVLEPGQTYFWKVDAETLFDVVESEVTSFQIMDAETQASLDQGLEDLARLSEDAGSASYQFLLGNLYANHGALGQAIDAFENIASAHPDAESVHRVLASLYTEIGKTKKAVSALERAHELSSKE